jgi:hypothetical protein
MIDNPDRPIENQMLDYVWGDNEVEAAANCRAMAAKDSLRYNFVRRTSQKGKKWECHVLINHPEPETFTDRRQE